MTPIDPATSTAGPADHGRERAPRDRDHPGRQDRLRRQRRLGHGDPDRHSPPTPPAPPITVGRNRSAIAITPDGKTAYVANHGSGTVTPISTATNTAGTADHGRERPRRDRDHPGRQDRLRHQRRSGTVTPIDRHQHRRHRHQGREATRWRSRSPRTARPPTSPTMVTAPSPRSISPPIPPAPPSGSGTDRA